MAGNTIKFLFHLFYSSHRIRIEYARSDQYDPNPDPYGSADPFHFAGQDPPRLQENQEWFLWLYTPILCS